MPEKPATVKEGKLKLRYLLGQLFNQNTPLSQENAARAAINLVVFEFIP
jgi:hypothetical protein